MRRFLIRATMVVFMLLSITLVWSWAGPAHAQSGGYELTRSTMASSYYGSGGIYSLNATAGQSEAGGLIGANYTLVGGFWGGKGGSQNLIYLPLVLRNS